MKFISVEGSPASMQMYANAKQMKVPSGRRVQSEVSWGCQRMTLQRWPGALQSPSSCGAHANKMQMYTSSRNLCLLTMESRPLTPRPKAKLLVPQGQG